MDGGEPAQRGGAGAGLDGLGVLAAGLAQVGVQVDQAGQRDQPGGLDDLGSLGGEAAADLLDHPVLEEQVGRLATEESGVLDQVRRHSGASVALSVLSVLSGLSVLTAGSLPPSSR